MHALGIEISFKASGAAVIFTGFALAA